jgi:hypothetical protein
MNSEIIWVPYGEFILWDLEKNMEFHGVVTGTHGQFTEIRYVQKGNRKIHASDEGVIQARWTTRWEGTTSYTTYWDECLLCGKKFNIQEL